MSDWWTRVSTAGHEQGDLLFNFPVPTVTHLTTEGDRPEVTYRVDRIDAIVVTQTCDLENVKIRTVLLARVVSWRGFAAAQFAAGNSAVKSSAYIANLIRGDIPPLALLHQRSEVPALPWSVCDFRELYTVDRAHLDHFTTQPGSRQRLRLRSPYKEHFAQAFARFFMRVGLPHDAGAFAAEGKAEVADLK